MAQVGTASIKFEADVGQVSDTLISKMEEALSKIDTILARLPDSVDAQAKAAGDSLGSNIEDGAQRADAAVSDVGKGGFTAAEQASQRAADIVAGEFQSGSLDAESALAGITGDGFTIVTGSASSAASSVASRFVEEAGRAEAALTGIDGDGFRSATSSGTSAAGSIRDVMQQAASDAASAWNQATSEISAAWQEASAQADRSFGQGGGIAGKVAGGATAFLGLAGATNVMTSAFAKNTSIEDTTAVLEVLMGNAEDATALMDDLVESNWVTPIPFDIWADAGKTLVAFGMDADDVAGTVTALGEAGAASGDGAEGLSRLSRAFGQAMATGTMQNDTLNQLAEAGVPALDILANHYGVTSEEMKKMASEGLPAEEAIRVLTEGIMEGTDGVAGSTAAFSGTMAELAGTTSGTLGNLGAAFTNVASTAIDPLLGGLQSFAEWLTEVLYKGQDLIVWFQEGGPEVERLTKIIVGTAGAIMTLLLPAFVQARVQAGIMAAGKIAAWFKVQTAAWSAMTATVRSIAVMIGNWVRLGAQALIQGARIAAGWLIAMGPVGWIIGIIALVAGAFITLWNTSEGFRNFWIGLWDTIKNAASDAWLWIQETWQTYGQPVVDFVVSAFQWLWQALQLVFRLLGAAWEVFVTALGKAWDAWGQPIVDAVVAYFQWAWGNLQTVFGWVKTGWDLLWAGIQSVYNNVILPVIGWIVAGFQGLWSGLQTIFGWISGAISTVGSVMSGLWSDYVQPMIDRVVDGFNRLMDTIRGWKDNVIGWFSDAGTWLLDAGKNIVNGIIDGVKSMAGELANAFLNIVPDWVKDPFKEALGIASPSKVFAGYGRNIGEGIIEGVSGISSDVQAATSGLARAAADVPLPDPPTGSTTAALPSDTGLTDASASLGATMAPAWDSMAEQMTATTTSVIDPMLLSVQSGLQGTAAQFPLQAYGTVLPAWSSMAGNMAATKVGVIDPALAGITSNLQATSAQFPTQVWGSIVPA